MYIFCKPLYPSPIRRLFQKLVLSSAMAAIASVAIASPVWAAERLFFFFGPFQLSVYMDSLEKFAEDGTVTQDLGLYLNRVDEPQREEFRKALLQPVEVNPLEISRMLNTPIGEMVLTQLGNVVTLPSGGNGEYAIRAAITEAVFADDGLTMLSFLKSFPTDIRINPNWIFSIANSLERVIDDTDLMIDQVEQLSLAAIASETPVDFPNQLDLRLKGPFDVSHQTWILTDSDRQFPAGSDRDRQFRVLIYQPQTWREGQTPVVVMSHGLASNPEDRAKLAEHLASHGFLVALPQHPGSDSQHVADMLAGYHRAVFAVEDFIDRPLDITHVLDELDARNADEFGGRLDLDSVGLLGHSFGGYTALALAGATIDTTHLRTDCEREGYLNVSLLLQCRALVLPSIPSSFRDERVAAVIAVNPVNNSIFGPDGLAKVEIPVALVAGSLDPAAPAIFEQLLSFPWITSPDKYLILSEGQAHVDFSQLDAGISQTLNSLSNLTLPNPDLLDSYGNALSLAFFEAFIAQRSDYALYLQSGYAQYVSQEPFGIHLLKANQEDELIESLENVGLLD